MKISILKIRDEPSLCVWNVHTLMKTSGIFFLLDLQTSSLLHTKERVHCTRASEGAWGQQCHAFKNYLGALQDRPLEAEVTQWIQRKWRSAGWIDSYAFSVFSNTHILALTWVSEAEGLRCNMAFITKTDGSEIGILNGTSLNIIMR